jgi:hypothetical protein
MMIDLTPLVQALAALALAALSAATPYLAPMLPRLSLLDGKHHPAR